MGLDWDFRTFVRQHFGYIPIAWAHHYVGVTRAAVRKALKRGEFSPIFIRAGRTRYRCVGLTDLDAWVLSRSEDRKRKKRKKYDKWGLTG